MKKTTWKEIEKWINEEMLGKRNEKESIYEQTFFNPTEYMIWQNDRAIVADMIHDKFTNQEWYHKYKPEVRDIIGFAVAITEYLNRRRG